MKNNTLCKKAAILLLLPVMLSLAACKDERDILKSSKKEQTAVMTVDGYEVPMEMYRYVALNLKSEYEAEKDSDIWLGEDGAALIEKLQDNIEDTILNMYTTVSLCGEYGISADDKFITDSVEYEMDAIYESYGYDYEIYSEDIKNYYMTDNVYRFIVKNDILAEELLAKMMNDGVLPSSDEELEGILVSEEFVCVKQVLIPFDNGLSAEENLKKAEEVLDKANNGEDFEQLIKDYGGDLYLFGNDGGYYVTEGIYHLAFEEAAFSLEIGEISGIVETDAGYSIIKRYAKDPVYMAENFDTLVEDYISGQYNLILAEHKESLSVEPTTELENISVFSLTMDK